MAPIGLRHWMLHNDVLAKEYDETLELSPHYDAVREVDPALIFHAPLLTGPDSISGAIRAEIGRNSRAIYRAPLGRYLLQAAEFESRHEYDLSGSARGVLMEPATTNKCENVNLNPPLSDPALSKGGDVNATLERVSDIDYLRLIGAYPGLVSSGHVWELDNRLGSGNAFVQISGGTINTNVHAISGYWRGSGFGAMRLNLTSATEVPIPSNYERHVEILTPSTSEVMRIVATGGSRVLFFLNQLEENVYETSPIETYGNGGATSRAADQLSWPLAGAFSGIAGMFAFCWRPQIGHADIAQTEYDLLGVSRSALTLAFLNLAGANHRVCTRDGQPNDACVQFPGNAINANQDYLIAGYFDSGGKEIGIKTAGAWSWSGLASYASAYPDEDELILNRGITAPAHFGQVALWNLSRGREWLETALQGVCE